VVAEEIPWCSLSTSRFTTFFEEAVAFLVQRCDKTSVQEMFNIAWVTVGQIVKRVVQRYHPGDPLDGLTAIGIDEISYRKGHKYVTTITDHNTGRIVWAKEGKNAETLKSFFEELGDNRCQKIAAVTMDMSEAYISAVKEKVSQAQIIFDRFHVQKLVNEALEKTRREEWQRLRDLNEEEAKKMKGLRWPLLKNPWNLTPKQSNRLSTLQRDNDRLYRAYLLKETFADILDRHQPNVVKTKLEDWISWANRSRLPGFVKVARTIRKHLTDIVAYTRWRLTNGIVEGLNRKIRVITHRAYGFHSASALIGMIMLCCNNIWLAPPQVRLAK
jgi:transposase